MIYALKAFQEDATSCQKIKIANFGLCKEGDFHLLCNSLIPAKKAPGQSGETVGPWEKGAFKDVG